MANQSSHQFPTTAWSMVRIVQGDRNDDRLLALNRFISSYWRPVFYFIRAKGRKLEQAEDLTQEFFLRLLERDWIDRADPERGRFRTFLLTILTRFLSDQGRRAPLQHQFDQGLVSVSALMGDEDRTFEPTDINEPEDVFMHQWAIAVLARAERQVAQWCNEQGRPDWFVIFQATYFPPPGASRMTQQELATRLKQSRDQVRYGLEQANKQFMHLLREEVGDQVERNEEIDGEIQELLRLIGKR